jgi:hypothetical protein
MITFKVNIMTADDVEVQETHTDAPISSLMNIMFKLYKRLWKGEVNIVTIERIDNAKD